MRKGLLMASWEDPDAITGGGASGARENPDAIAEGGAPS